VCFTPCLKEIRARAERAQLLLLVKLVFILALLVFELGVALVQLLVLTLLLEVRLGRIPLAILIRY